jgi:hypothetical protein
MLFIPLTYRKTDYTIWAPTKLDQDLSGHLHCWAIQLLSLLKNNSSLDHYTYDSVKHKGAHTGAYSD